MKTGDIYFNRNGRVCVYFRGGESAFTSESFDTLNKNAGLESTNERGCILMYNCTEDNTKPTGVTIMDILNDPIIKDYLRKKCNE